MNSAPHAAPPLVTRPPVPPKPIWSEGLFVSQHHFLAQDLYHEANLNERIAAVRRFDWGLLDCAIDERLLQVNEVALLRLDAVWPDGLAVRCGGATGFSPPPPRSFEGLFPPELDRLDVYAAIAASEQPSGSPAAANEPHARFRTMTRRIVDPTSGSTQDVDFAVPNVRIVFGSETRDGLVLLPIAQLVREPGGRVCVRHAFVPPVLRLGASPALNGGLARVVGAISARQRELASARKRRSSTSIEFHSSDAPRFWMLHTLSASLPVLKHLLDSERAHPEEVYLALVSLVGQLETFAPGEGEALPAFNYLALGQVFEAIFGRVLSLLAADAAPTFSQVPLQHRADGAFMGKIADRGLLNCDFFVGIDSGQPEPALRERVPQILKIAAWNQIYEIVKQARHGVRVEVDWHPSASLPLQPGRCFFRLRREGAFWEEIAKTGTIALYLPADSDWKDASVSVYAVRAEQTK